MKKIYILRHGKAEEAKNHDDFRRHLSLVGESDVRGIAHALMHAAAQPDYILSSASLRTKETAQIIAAFLGISQKRQIYNSSFYEGSYKLWWTELKKLGQEVNEILLVGHNPGLEVLIRQMTDRVIDLPPGGLVALSTRGAWADIATAKCRIEGISYPHRYKKRQTESIVLADNCFQHKEHPPLVPQNRELSLLSFNARVAQEAADKSNNPIERLTFIGIVSSNLEEFYRVRVGALAAILQKKGSKKNQPAQDLSLAVQERVQNMQALLSTLLAEILKELEEKHDIVFIDEKSLNAQQRRAAVQLFENEIRAGLSVIFQPGKKTLQSYMRTDTIYLAVRLRNINKKVCYALVEIPTHRSERFIPLPIVDRSDGSKRLRYLRLDDLLRLCLPDYFNLFGYTLESAHCIKITRNAELGEIDWEGKDDSYMYEIYKKREVNKIVRLIYDREMPKDVLTYFRRRLDIAAGFNLLPGERYHNHRDFIGFRPPFSGRGLTVAKAKPLPTKAFNGGSQRYFDAVEKKDVMLHFPYHDFRHVVNLLREASLDPAVTHIDITLYRVAETSEIIDALINARYNGKIVTVMMEIKARFNEEDNLRWRRLLINHDITVLEQFPDKKVHAKICLIRRKKYPNIALFSTGNFNEKTARLYCDNALITTHKGLCADALNFFQILSNPEKVESFEEFRHLLVSPRNMRGQFVELINQEIENAIAGKPAAIYLKLNNLNDPGMTHLLHKAAVKGVRLKLIVRSTFSLNPELPEYEGRMQAISIVDTLLEHSRILIFLNNTNPQVYISSADFLTRNLDRRYEVATPIYDKSLQQQLIKILDLQLADNVKARLLNSQQDNTRQVLAEKTKTRSQKALRKLLQ